MSFFILVAFIYAIFTCFLAWMWYRIPSIKPNQSKLNISFSVIIPARNEAENIAIILSDLSNQSFQNFEVIVVDDASEDETLNIANSFVSQLSSTFKVISLKEEAIKVEGKKAAINTGIEIATGNYIVTTDADCSVGKDWLLTIAQCLSVTKAKLISAPVTFYGENSLFEKIQTVEFMSLIGAGAAFMHLKTPNMCNGANICYEKKVFEEVGGFSGNEHIASGDDEFLMHKIASKYPENLKFLKAKQAIVRTKALPDLKTFFNQRKRWGSKWNHYKSISPKLVAIFVFCFHLVFCSAFIAFIGGFISSISLTIIFLIKLIPEILFITPILTFSGHKKLIWLIPVVAVIHPIYVVLFGLAGNFGSFNWKDRVMN